MGACDGDCVYVEEEDETEGLKRELRNPWTRGGRVCVCVGGG